MNVIKRDGNEVKFNKKKIREAICKAMKNGSGIYLPDIAKLIANDAEKHFLNEDIVTIFTIEEFVYNRLIHYGQTITARSYEDYRAVQQFKRNSNTTDESILELINKNNEDVMMENSNKNAVINATQRDLIAGEVSKDISRRKLIPTHIVQAHDEGIIHWHDMDYTLSPMFNCFTGNTEFVTSQGIKTFKQCGDGTKVNVLDKDGIWRSAVVRNYGKQKVNKVVLNSCKTEKEILVTNNHRWILKDGEVTTNLKVGDRLHLLKNLKQEIDLDTEMFCFGFILGDGTEYNNSDINRGLRVRLCGNKVQYKNKFEQAGYTISSYKENGDVWITKATSLSKKDFLQNKKWKDLNYKQLYSLFSGYYAADGSKDRNGIGTSDENLACMIREISCICGYHITSENVVIRDTNYKKNSKIYSFRFMISQPSNRNWKVKEITNTEIFEDVWCVEEPITKTFTLNNGVVTGNCCLINLEDMFTNGTVINEKLVEEPKSFGTACTVATQIIAQISSNQYGGQSITIKHLAKYLKVTEEKAYAHYLEKFKKEDLAKELATDLKLKELRDGIQTIRYQLSTLQTTNGQSPFSTIYLEIEQGHPYETEMAMICEEMIKQRLEGMKNVKGQEIGEAFPKLVYLLDDHNCLEGGKYDYITELCAVCNTKRLVPDYQSAKMMRMNYEGNTFPPMGCRSHLSPWKDANGNYKWYGRFNQGVVSLNLPQIGIMANGDFELFWEIFDERLELCKEALLIRHNMLLGTTSDASPIHWQHGGISRLEKGEKIDKLLKGGYSTLSLGYVGIYEMVQSMLGVSHTSTEGEKFAVKVMTYMKSKCDEWKKETGLGFGLYGTPAESLIYRFCRIDKQRFGEIENVTDRLYYTNSYHVHVQEEIDAFEKLKFESQFHGISNGGCISYIEVPDMSKNLEAVKSIINYIYHNIQYAEINTKPDICYKCGYTGEIQLDKETLEWYCPSCGNTDKSEMQVMRRTCGYIGTTFWNKGRTAEIGDRVLHL